MKQKDKKIRVVVGLSGGVDSSVTAALLKEQGYDVVGVYMKNWNTESPTLGRRTLHPDEYRDACPWYEDYLDAKRVALKLGIPFHLWDFREAYKQKVFDHIIDEFEAGRTPNPDVYCNNLIKFDDFLKKAVEELGADYVATGHYARKYQITNTKSQINYKLQIPKDKKKDQTYFLHRLTQEQLSNVMFPLADYTKEEVRELAKTFDLPTKYKKDSVGLCYVGDVELRGFLSRWLAPKKGDIRDLEGRVIGKHQGVHLATLGERVPVDNAAVSRYYPALKTAIPTFYVAEKDIEKNVLIAVPGHDHPALYKKRAVIESIHWVDSRTKDFNMSSLTGNDSVPDRGSKKDAVPVSSGDSRSETLTLSIGNDKKVFARLRHGGALVSVESVELLSGSQLRITFAEPQRAVTPGQHLVLYDTKKAVLGGGIIC